MLDKSEIIVRLLSERHVVKNVMYAATCLVMAEFMNGTVDDMTVSPENDYAICALQDMAIEAHSRYTNDMRHVLMSIMDNHGATLKLLDISEEDVKTALKLYAEEVYQEVYEQML